MTAPDLIGDTCRALEEVLADVTYKPGWTFVVDLGCLQVEVVTIDSDPPHRPVAISHRFVIPLYLPEVDQQGRLHWLFDQIMAVERHEAAEFFLVAGEAPFHPHRKTKP